MKIRHVYSLFCTVLLLAACQQKNEHQDALSQPKVISSSHSESMPPLLAEKKLHKVKLGAPVSLVSNKNVILNENEITKIDIVLNAKFSNGSMSVQLNPSEGLQVLSNSTLHTFSPDASNQYLFSVDLLAKKSARYYLNLNVVIDDGENASSRTLAVIVQVGAPPASGMENIDMHKQSNDKNIIVLPAQENISH